MATVNELIQPRDVEHLLRVLGRKTRRSSLVRRPEIYSETVSVDTLLQFLMWLDDSSPRKGISEGVRTYLAFHMRPEDYEAGSPVDHIGMIKKIAEKAQSDVEKSGESDWPGILTDALEEIVRMSLYHE